MRRLVLTGACVALSAAAGAADLPPRRATAPAAVYAEPLSSWSGAYAGVNAGFGFGGPEDELYSTSAFLAAGHGPEFFGVVQGGTVAGLDAFAAVPAGGSRVQLGNPCAGGGCGDRRGPVGGGQIGYNWQVTPGSGVVLGVEADLQLAGLSRSRDAGFGPGMLTFTGGAFAGVPAGVLLGPPSDRIGFFDPRIGPERGVDWFGTVRGRLGYAFDRLLVFGTGGFAYGGGARGIGDCGFGSGGCDRRVQVGWTAGGGLEYAVTKEISVKLEGLYVGLDRRNESSFRGSLPYARLAAPSLGIASATLFAPASAFSAVSPRRSDGFALVRVGLNYRFGWGGSDAVALAPIVVR